MTREHLRALLDQAPFRPFRVRLDGGVSYDVTVPDRAMVLPSTTAVAVTRGGEDVIATFGNDAIRAVEVIAAE